jgi:virginiamycin B lyase
VGPDGDLWFTDEAGIGRITPAGTITAFPLPSGDGSPGDLTVGPDGNLWFPEYPASSSGPGAIGRITPAGAITDFPLPAGNGTASSLTLGPDGNLWFSEQLGGFWFPTSAIGRITPGGALTEFPLPAGAGPFDLTIGPDGNFWFLESHTGTTPSYSIGRITPAGALTDDLWLLAAPSGNGEVAFPTGDLAAGPDGNLWILEYTHFGGSGPAIVRITPAGAETAFPLPPGDGSPGELTGGLDGNLWFPADNPGEIGRIALDTLPPPLSVTRVVAVTPSRKAITTILLWFDEALDPASARSGYLYGLAAGVASGQTIVFSKGVNARVSYKHAAHVVRVRLAVPHKGPIELTIRYGGLLAADGMASSGDFTAVVM